MGLVHASNTRAQPALPQEHVLPFKKAQINEGIFMRLENVSICLTGSFTLSVECIKVDIKGLILITFQLPVISFLS